MDVRQMEYFLAVVDNGGINRAAVALHVAQPSLSQSIRKLESELKTQLFHRVGRGLVIAPAGEALVGPARQVLRDMEAAQAAVREVREVKRGRIDIAALADMSTDPLSVWVARFRVRHPDMRLRVEERDDVAGVLELVHSGACELGVTTLPQSQHEFFGRRLVTQNFVLVLPPGTESELPDTVPLEMLAGIPLVMGERRTASRDYIEQALRGRGIEPHVVVEVPQRGAVLPMVVSGAGAAILPLRMALEAHQRGAVVKEVAPTLTREVGAVHRVGRVSEAAVEFLDYSAEIAQQWESAVARRQAGGHSWIEAAALTVAAMERHNLAGFRDQSPLRRDGSRTAP
ncbi:LysR family transcriptional regulator [Rhodococcus erythropolis]|uniref:LysR family transcriptional regulator n=2 Tax=Bacteria TaxID=2 RepID=UPI001D17474B|nr:LysR family transcriptional regulator [Rhodococcus erythropolis]